MSADDDITRQERPAEASVGGGLALFTDLYQLTMLQAYFEERMTERAVFSLFVRRLPPRRNFLIACGLDIVLEYLESLRFTVQDLTTSIRSKYSPTVSSRGLPTSGSRAMSTPSVKAPQSSRTNQSWRSRPPCPRRRS